MRFDAAQFVRSLSFMTRQLYSFPSQALRLRVASPNTARTARCSFSAGTRRASRVGVMGMIPYRYDLTSRSFCFARSLRILPIDKVFNAYVRGLRRAHM